MIKKCLRKIAFRYKHIEMKFKLYIGFKKNTIIEVGNKDRCVGKTTMLVKMSKKYDIPIFVGTANQANIINRHYCKTYFRNGYTGLLLTYKNKIAFSASKDLPEWGTQFYSGAFPNGVFIDETITDKQIEEIRNSGIKIRTGFIYRNN